MYRGTITQRVLLTYRVNAAWLRQQLPPGFSPTLVNGTALAGICILRWRGLGPAVLPGRVGLAVDGVAERWFAHRTGRAHVPGVVVPRRWIRGRGAAGLTRMIAGGEADHSRLAFNRHGRELRVRTTDRDLFDVTVTPVAKHDPAAVFDGDPTAIGALHATAARGWSVCRNATVAATDMAAVDGWSPQAARLVTGSQRILPSHAELDHVVVMEDVRARLDPVREALAADRLAAVAADDLLQGEVARV